MKTLRHKLLVALASIGILSCSPQEKAAESIQGKGVESTALTHGANHIGFTVSNLSASTEFFTEVLGWKEVGGVQSYPSRFVSDGVIMVTLWQADQTLQTQGFNRKTNVGLHHFAMTLPDLETLDALHTTLESRDNIEIEFAPELLGSGPTQHMMIRDPSGLRLEFIVPGGKRSSID